MAFPVMKAFRTTLAYLQQHAPDLLKALWLPAVLLVALQFYAISPLFTAMAAILELGDNPDPAEAAAFLGEFVKWGALLTLGSAIVIPMMTVASLRHIVRGETQREFFYLRYGGDELRILAAYVLLTVMVMLIAIVGGLAVSIFALIFALAGPAAKALAASAGNFGVNVLTAWFRLRLSVLFPASIATRTIGFGVSWEATKGDVLRLLLFWALIGLILIPVGLVAAAPLFGDLLPLMQKVAEAGSDETAAREALIPLLRRLASIFSLANPQAAFLAPIFVLSTMASTAIVNVAGGAAWRLLTDDAAPKPPAQAAEMAA